MYVILINEDNTMTTTSRQRIMQRSKLVDDLYFLMKPEYNGHSMAEFTLSLEYVLPVSRKYRTEILKLSPERYKGYLQYHLPFDTKLTSEAGEIELAISFLLVGLDDAGHGVQRVRKVGGEKIVVCPTSAWSDIIPDEALSALDQRILKTDAQIKELQEMSVLFDLTKADGLEYDDDTNELRLMAGETPIDEVILKECDANEDGIVVVDIGEKKNLDTEEGKNETDNVVDF